VKFLKLQQGSEEWLRWRKGLITATDAAMIMGESPYSTAYQCWQRKVGLLPEPEVTAPMRRGTRDEPIARELFHKSFVDTNLEKPWEPECIESGEYNFLGASLDGISEDGEVILEIKSTNFHDSPNEIPKFHWIQMQHQMLCGDGSIDKCYYVRYWDGKINVQMVKRDDEWAKEYLPKAQKFWECVALMEPPELAPEDYRHMQGVQEWRELSEKYKDYNYQIKDLEEKKEQTKKKLIDLAGERNCLGGGIKLFKKFVKGRVDYDAIPEIKSVDLDKYRKPSSSSWTITLDKK